jgi:signal transduction histidine kinase
LDSIRDILANARKYSKPGRWFGLTILQVQQQIFVRISDNGCGIPEHEVEKVLQFGYRASNVTQRRTFGGGYGLTKAAYYTKQSGGTIDIQSKLGVGTTVTLSVPFGQ